MVTLRGIFRGASLYETTLGIRANAGLERFDDGSRKVVTLWARGKVVEAVLWLRAGQPVEIEATPLDHGFEVIAVTPRTRSAMLRPFGRRT